MRLHQFAMVGMAFACGVCLMVGTVRAEITLPGAAGDLLLGNSVAATDFFTGYPPAGVTDGHAIGDNADYLSDYGHAYAQIAISLNSSSALGTIRIWSQADGTAPTAVSILSSTDNTSLSLNPASYQKTLANNATPAWTTQQFYDPASGLTVSLKYFDVDVSHVFVAGTQSLYFDFPGTESVAFCRIGEIQAYAVPEPATIVLLGTGLIGLLAYAWRKRK